METRTWDRVHNRPADIYTPPEDRVEPPRFRADVPETRKGPSEPCFDEACDSPADVRMSIDGKEVLLCAAHARHLVVTQ